METSAARRSERSRALEIPAILNLLPKSTSEATVQCEVFVKPGVENRLAQIRKSRGVSASDLADRVHVSRQTIYAIEAGTYVPNTEVALHLARELEVGVDDLFSLPPSAQSSPDSLTAAVLSATPPLKGQPVRVCQIGNRW